ncbi:MAG: class I SAM-dependent methyltransferase [Chromatiales bacterium]|nr:class I SAM-dependent methyltransferase [Chromatiales bacterium]
MGRTTRRKTTEADKADRYRLYQESVQDVESEIDFVDETYTRLNGAKARLLREDFCGTANTACEWVRRRKTNVAYAIDINPEALAWGMTNNVAALTPTTKKRVHLLEGDVRYAETEPLDIVLAMNFSYWLFMEREEMLEYFTGVHGGLGDKGVFFLDAYGGYDAPRTIQETRECDGFTYEWEQAKFNPINSEMDCYIHFGFPDGSRMEKAFTYTWRLWTLPEIREMLYEAGFQRVTIYWQGWDEDGEPDGIFQPAEEAEPDAGWICYISAEK